VLVRVLVLVELESVVVRKMLLLPLPPLILD
jgi:hypothetical protein